MQKVTIKDIARECDVSLSTVSLVLNNNPRISEKTRQHVLATVKKYNYQPNSSARGLASRSSFNVSVVVPHMGHVFADVYFGEIISGIYEQASEDGFKVMLDIANERFLKSGEYINILRARRADGMLFIGATIDDSFPLSFEDNAYPFLLVNHFYPGSSLNYCNMNYKESARQAAEHLAGLGHRKIGLIHGINTHTGILFSNEFIAHCEKLGIPREHIFAVDGGQDWGIESGFVSAQTLISAHPEITAIMAANDRMAIGAISHLQKIGKTVPDDISVMGIDDIHNTAFSTPSLTTVWHDLYEMGKRSFSNLLAICKKQRMDCHEVMPVTLIERNSTGPARK